jgi:hypothetical protein
MPPSQLKICGVKYLEGLMWEAIYCMCENLYVGT